MKSIWVFACIVFGYLTYAVFVGYFSNGILGVENILTTMRTYNQAAITALLILGARSLIKA